jgi:hypothetical protein
LNRVNHWYGFSSAVRRSAELRRKVSANNRPDTTGQNVESYDAGTILNNPKMWESTAYVERLWEACPRSPEDPVPCEKETPEKYVELVRDIIKGGKWEEYQYDDARWLDDMSPLLPFGDPVSFDNGANRNLQRRYRTYFENAFCGYFNNFRLLRKILIAWKDSPTLQNEIRAKRLAFHICMQPYARLIVPVKRQEGPYDRARYVLDRMLESLQKSGLEFSTKKMTAAVVRKLVDFRCEHGEDRALATQAAEETVKLWLCVAGVGESEKITAEHLRCIIAECGK